MVVYFVRKVWFNIDQRFITEILNETFLRLQALD